MIMNMSANMLGLGNAATPFGLKAMQELDRLNPRKGVATDAMALFLAINTSGVAVFPLGVIAIRAALGSENAGGILLPSILATFCSTVVAVLVARALARRPAYAAERYAEAEAEAEPEETLTAGIRGLDEAEETVAQRPPASRWRVVAMLLVTAVIAVGLAQHVAGASADGRLEEAGRELLQSWLLAAVMPATSLIGFPAEALPMALVRPLSGSGAMGVMMETMKAYGPDSFVGFLVSVMNGSTETTFYVLALYFGSVRVRAARHTVVACLAADATGVLAALLWCRIFF
jgi:spore maturation protein SpmB